MFTRLDGQPRDIDVCGRVKGCINGLSIEKLCSMAIVAIAVSIGMVDFSVASDDKQFDSKQYFDIESGDVGSALTQFADLSQIQVLFTPEVVKSKQSSTLKGVYTNEEALSTILSGTDLEYKEIEDNTYLIIEEGQKTYEGRELENIIVTAQKREQKLIDVPISMSVIGSQDIERQSLVGMGDYLAFVPGVTMLDWGVGRPRITMRGLGTVSDTEQATVATYLGELQLNNQLAFNSADIKLVDIERVEVLRGPQGTLFGGGSIGGAVRNIPVAPDLSEYSGKVEIGFSSIEYSNDNGGNIVGVFNAPLIKDTLGVRVAAYRYENAGYIDYVSTPRVEAASTALGVPVHVEEDANSSAYAGGRASILFQPNEQFDATLMLMWQKLEENGGSSDVTIDLGGYQAELLKAREREGNYDDYKAINLVMNYHFSWGDLTSTTSHFDQSIFRPLNQSRFFTLFARPTMTISDYDVNLFTQEIRLASNLSGPLQFVVGAYYEELESGRDYRVDWFGSISSLEATYGTSDPTTGIYNLVRTDAADQSAVFGELYYQLTDSLKLTGGWRWFDYTRVTDATTTGVLAGPDTHFPTDESDAIFKTGLDYKPNENTLIYAIFSQGFRLGRGVAPPSQLQIQDCDADSDGREDVSGLPFNLSGQLLSDRTDNYELGGKFDLMDNRLTIAASIYRIDWSDLPVNTFVPGCQIFINGGEARSQGGEIEVGYLVTDNLQVNLSSSYVNAEFTTDDLAPAGTRLPMSAKVNASAGVEYTFPLAGHDAFVRSDFSYIGDYNASAVGNTRVSGDYVLTNMRAGIAFDQLDIEVFVRNLTGEDAETSNWYSFWGFRVRPRTIGVTLRREF